MRGSTLVTSVDVYTEEIPSTSSGVIMSGGDSGAPLQNSMPSAEYDMPDEVQPGKIIALDESKPTTNGNANISPANTEITEVDGSVVTIQSKLKEDNKIQSNGVDHAEKGKFVEEPDDDTCLIQCIYVTQQCCECTIL